MLPHLAIAIILGAIGGVIAGKLLARANMGLLWNAIVGALSGIVVANFLAAFGFDERDPYLWSLLFALGGGALGTIVIGLCRPGLTVFWEVVTGKSSGRVARR